MVDAIEGLKVWRGIFDFYENFLEKIWKEIEKYEGEEKRNFYSKLNYISEKLEREKIEDKDFHVNVEMASSIEKRIKNLYYENKFKIENLTQEETYKNKINPFKKYIDFSKLWRTKRI